MSDEALRWAYEEFGRADLGDVRRTARLVRMGAAACERPSGKVAAVFATDRERFAEEITDFASQVNPLH